MNKKQLVAELVLQGIRYPSILAAIKKIPRHLFISEEEQKYAYTNSALPIVMGKLSYEYYTAINRSTCSTSDILRNC